MHYVMDPKERELESVFAHRMRMFLILGLNATEAEIMAGADHVDWHDVRRLVEKGCSPTTAAKILL